MSQVTSPLKSAKSWQDRAIRKAVHESVVYNVSWEDPRLDHRLFAEAGAPLQKDDHVLMFTSAGDNVIDSLIEGPPRCLVTVDFNQHQNALLEFKLAAIKTLTIEEARVVFGVAAPDAAEPALAAKPPPAALVKKVVAAMPRAAAVAFEAVEQDLLKNSYYRMGTSGQLSKGLVKVMGLVGLAPCIDALHQAGSTQAQRQLYLANRWRFWMFFTAAWNVCKPILCTLAGVPESQMNLAPHDELAKDGSAPLADTSPVVCSSDAVGAPSDADGADPKGGSHGVQLGPAHLDKSDITKSAGHPLFSLVYAALVWAWVSFLQLVFAGLRTVVVGAARSRPSLSKLTGGYWFREHNVVERVVEHLVCNTNMRDDNHFYHGYWHGWIPAHNTPRYLQPQHFTALQQLLRRCTVRDESSQSAPLGDHDDAAPGSTIVSTHVSAADDFRLEVRTQTVHDCLMDVLSRAVLTVYAESDGSDKSRVASVPPPPTEGSPSAYWDWFRAVTTAADVRLRARGKGAPPAQFTKAILLDHMDWLPMAHVVSELQLLKTCARPKEAGNHCLLWRSFSADGGLSHAPALGHMRQLHLNAASIEDDRVGTYFGTALAQFKDELVFNVTDDRVLGRMARIAEKAVAVAGLKAGTPALAAAKVAFTVPPAVSAPAQATWRSDLICLWANWFGSAKPTPAPPKGSKPVQARPTLTVADASEEQLAADHRARLDAFYRTQATSYDSFRPRMLHGKRLLLESLPLVKAPRAAGGLVWVDVGCGTADALEMVAQHRASFARVLLLDVCAPLIAVARARIQKLGLQDLVEVRALDLCTHAGRQELRRERDIWGAADLVTMNYSLSMMQHWPRALQALYGVCAPGGHVMVSDFTTRGANAGRTLFWKHLFSLDRVYLTEEHLSALPRIFEKRSLAVNQGGFPYVPYLQCPYYVFLGIKSLRANERIERTLRTLIATDENVSFDDAILGDERNDFKE